MALLQDAYQDLDPLTLNAVIEIQLEDSAALAGSSKGKQREGTVKDVDIALEVLTEDLRAWQCMLEDRNMARSMALAVYRDGELISRAHQQEDQIARDRQMAAGLEEAPDLAFEHHAGQDSGQQQGQAMQDPWVTDELLEKAAALYNHDSISAGPASVYNDCDAEEDETTAQAESSAWGASRLGKAKQKLGHCIACGDTKDFFDVARVPCDHEYCRECLASLFQASLTDESLFPPRCDGQPIPLNQVRFFLPVELAKEFEEKFVELSTKDRTYCHDPRCSTFLPQLSSVDGTEGDWLTCTACDKTTCSICKAAAHTGDCPDDTAMQQLIDTAGNEQWQRCYQCHRFVELTHGCNHMSCPCGAQFCYVCGMQWHTCPCDEWQEDRLYARAAQIARRNTNPRHRLFEPERGARPQPPHHSDYDDEGNITLPATGSSPFLARNRRGPVSDVDDSSSAAPAANENGSSSAVVPTSSNNRDIDALMDRLREDHECLHARWRWIEGPHQCEECHDELPLYIFECRQCMLQACNRCRRNRLRRA